VTDQKEKQQGTYPAADSQAAPGANVGAYAQGNGYGMLDLSPDNWEREAKTEAGRPWSATPQGRLAIRSLSRGIMGAAFFTWGGLQVRKLVDYHPDKEAQNYMHILAKCFDKCAGKPIEWTMTQLAGAEAGRRAVTFRPTKQTSSVLGLDGKQLGGRSLGHEAVAITFDFAMASLGDALGRDLAGLFDPNVKKKWVRKDGSVDFPEAVKGLVKNTWRYLSYNAGEDWAVALPYAYYVRAQRNLINHFSPGFCYDSDRNLNGGSFKIDDHGKIVGNFNKEGALDLQGRFTVYNMGTLLYREAYDYAANLINGRPASLYGPRRDLDEPRGKMGVVGGITNFGKWVARGVVKAGIYMTPAVPFFWITRTPQTKYRGLFIHPEKGLLTFKDSTGQLDGLYCHSAYTVPKLSNPGEPTFFCRYNGDMTQRSSIDGTFGWDDRPSGIPNLAAPSLRPDPYGQTFGPFDSVLNAAGKFNNRHRGILDKLAPSWVDDDSSTAGRTLRHALGLKLGPLNATSTGHSGGRGDSIRRFLHPMVNASFSYTPYMYAKGEAALLWDSGKMDVATERMIDGAANLNWGEFSQGAGETWRAIFKQKFKDPEREQLAQDRIRQDTSLADVFGRKENGNGNGNGNHHSHSFTNQVRQERAARSAPATPEPRKNYTDNLPRPAGFAAQEALRQEGDIPAPGTTIH